MLHTLYKFRCTRNKPYVGTDCPGAKDPRDRNGYYVDALSHHEAYRIMCGQFPSEVEIGFTVRRSSQNASMPVKRVRPSESIARKFPNALDWDWYTIPDHPDDHPFIRRTSDVLEDEKRKRYSVPVLRDRPTVVLSADEVEQRFPRLVKAIGHGGYFSLCEARCVIRDYLQGRDAMWWGRTGKKVIQDAFCDRKQVSKFRTRSGLIIPI